MWHFGKPKNGQLLRMFVHQWVVSCFSLNPYLHLPSQRIFKLIFRSALTLTILLWDKVAHN